MFSIAHFSQPVVMTDNRNLMEEPEFSFRLIIMNENEQNKIQ